MAEGGGPGVSAIWPLLPLTGATVVEVCKISESHLRACRLRGWGPVGEAEGRVCGVMRLSGRLS
jgi:hypothetical protein